MSKHVTAERAREAVNHLHASTAMPSLATDYAHDDLHAFIAQTEAEIAHRASVFDTLNGVADAMSDRISVLEDREAALVELLTECRKAMARYDYDCYEEGVSMPYRERTLREEVDLAIAAHRGDEES